MAKINRSRFKFLDQRTGRLARAVELTEDGEIPGLQTTRRNADKKHPLSTPVSIPPDRATYKVQYTERQGGTSTYRIGMEGTSTLGQRQTVPSVSYGGGDPVVTGTTGTEDEAATLLGSETEGLAISFVDQSARVRVT